MVQQYQSPVRVYKHPFPLVMMVRLLYIFYFSSNVFDIFIILP